jgi:membrane protein implicated in regulation of membrane protease activity
MAPASRRKHPPLLLAAIASVVSLVAAIVLTGVFAPSALRRDAAGLSTHDPGSRAEGERAIRVNDPSVCAVCGVVEAVRPYEIRATTAMPATEDVRESADANLVPRTAYRVAVQMEDGSYRVLSQPTLPAFKTGDRVRIVEGALVAR